MHNDRCVICVALYLLPECTVAGVYYCYCLVTSALTPPPVMGHVIKAGLELVGTGSTVRQNKQLAGDIARMSELAAGQNLSNRERLHVYAVELFAKG